MNKQIIVVLLLSLFIGSAQAQTFTNSPYSYYGLGDLEPSDYGRTTGMGGVGIGISSGQFLNRANPASLSSIDTLSFLFDVALSGKYSDYKTHDNGFTAITSGVRKLSMGFRINHFWATSLGIASYSNVGYKITQGGFIEGTTDPYTTTFEGNGGLSQLYWANSFKLAHNFSVGVDASYIFGSITKSEKVESPSFSGYYSLSKKYTPNHLYFDLGAQYSGKFDTWDYIIGVTGGLKTSLVTPEYITEETTTTTIASDVPTATFNQSIPAFWGLGTSIKSKSWVFAADYKQQYWGSLVNENGQHIYSNSRRIALGAEYMPGVSVPRHLYERMVYQAGFHYDQSYLKINGVNLDGYAVSVGLGIPGRKERNFMGMSFEVGKRGSLSNGLIRETYYQLNFTLSLNDIWFVRPKYQ